MLIGSIDALPSSPTPVRDGVVAQPDVANVTRAAPGAATQPAQAPAHEVVKQAISQANDALKSLTQALEFEYDTDANVMVIRLVDTQDQKVLRQVPTPEMLEIARALERMQTMLVRGKA